MANEFLTQSGWSRRLKIGEGAAQVDYGLWDTDDITFGSESKQIRDPDAGPGVVGGVPTSEPFTLNRVWKLDRESSQFATITALRGKNTAQLEIHERDPSTGEPRSSVPLMTIKGLVSETVLPGSDSMGSDESRTQLTFTPQTQS